MHGNIPKEHQFTQDHKINLRKKKKTEIHYTSCLENCQNRNSLHMNYFSPYVSPRSSWVLTKVPAHPHVYHLAMARVLPTNYTSTGLLTPPPPPFPKKKKRKKNCQKSKIKKVRVKVNTHHGHASTS